MAYWNWHLFFLLSQDFYHRHLISHISPSLTPRLLILSFIHLQSHPPQPRPPLASRSPSWASVSRSLLAHTATFLFSSTSWLSGGESISPVPSGEPRSDKPGAPNEGWGFQTLATCCRDGWEALVGKGLPKGPFLLSLFTCFKESHQETQTRYFPTHQPSWA